MEKQRSFSFKYTRFLLVSFTLSFSLVLLTSLSYWVIRATPSVHQQTHLQLNRPLLSPGFKVRTLVGFGTNFSAYSSKDPNLVDAHLREPQSSSGFDEVSYAHLSKPPNSSGFLSPEVFYGGEGEVEENEDESSDDVDVGGDDLTITERGNKNLTVIQEIRVDNASFDKDGGSVGEKNEGKRIKECDVSRGKWVFDESYPLYTNSSCPFIDEGFNCQGNGRLDKDYLKWRWQPEDCHIPRFNATKMLELIRGKRVVFVGDSINRNQWESLLCLLMEAVQDSKKVYETRGRKIMKGKGNYCFRFMDYQCNVEFYATHFLVHESKARIGQKRVPTLRIDKIDRGTSRWRGADILVFNTANWWTHSKTQAGINYYQDSDQVYPRLDAMIAFRRALVTWATWVDQHVNPQKTQVFFRSSAPSHFRGGQWNTGGHCKEAVRPVDGTFLDNRTQKDVILAEVIKRMKTPVTFLNVTGLSAHRIDGHPSVYGGKSLKRYSSSVEDCSHWCLPGVPDTWNELLYYQLIISRHNKKDLYRW
ncbi:hypothetical protein Dimus_016745 [Dionaea muscipula]